jgi:hypothetical protein
MTLIKNYLDTNQDGIEVMMWIFKDQDENLWVTETAIIDNEKNALDIILLAMEPQ